MLTQAFYLLVLQSQWPIWIPDALRKTSEFGLVVRSVWESEPDSGGSFRLLRSSDGATIDVYIAGDHSRGDFYPNALLPTTYSPPDGNPLGGECHIRTQTSHLYVGVLLDKVLARIEISSPRIVGKPYGERRVDDFTSDIPWAVAMVRETLSRFAAKRAGPLFTEKVNGRSVSAFLVAGSDAKYFRLDEYALAVGAALNRNETDKRYSFSARGIEVVALMGTDKIKIGGEWQTMLDIPIFRDGQVWVPSETLPK